MSNSITNADIDAINSRAYELFSDNVSLGPTIEGGTNVPIESLVSIVENSEQFEGTIAAIERALIHNPVTTEFLRADFEFLRTKLLANRVNIETDGITTNFKTGTKRRNLRSLAKKLRLHPVDNAANDFTEDIVFHMAVAKITGGLTGSRENFQSVKVEWIIFPDLDQLSGNEFATFGDWTLTEQTSIGVWIALGDRARTTSQHITASSFPIGAIDKLEVLAAFGTASAETLDLDNVGNMTATDLSLIFDALTTDNILNAGDYLKHPGGEFVRVASVSYATAVTGTATLDARGEFGSTAAVINDNDTLVIWPRGDIARLNKTDSAAWNSATPASATVGNVFNSTTEALNKGIVKHVGTGTTIITATVDGVASPDHTVQAA